MKTKPKIAERKLRSKTLPDAPSFNAGPQLGASIGELAEVLTGTRPTSRTSRELRFGAKGSLSIKLSGPNAPCWYDHEAGVGGGALSLVAHLRRCSMADAARWSRREWLRDALAAPASLRVVSTRPEPDRSTFALARRIWAEAVASSGTLVERYLASRGLELPAGAPLRFHSHAWRNRECGPHGPAMVALMTDPVTAEPIGAHVTYLRQDGSGKADGDRKKILLGHAGVVRLVPDEEVTAGLGISEGIETALAVMQHFGWRPVWAACSAGGIAGLPVLAGIEALTTFADSDDGGAGMEAAKTVATRWQAAGREVTTAAPPSGFDFADMPRRAVA